VQALTIDTTILVSTVFLSSVNTLPGTPAIYRSSTSRSNGVLDAFSSWGRTSNANMAKPR
jgi:hypothetical protein